MGTPTRHDQLQRRHELMAGGPDSQQASADGSRAAPNLRTEAGRPAGPAQARRPDAFISYAAADAPVAQVICAALERSGIRCWIAARDIAAGQPYSAAIMAGIESSRAMVFVLSSRSNVSEHTLREIERAVHNHLPVITVRIENVTPSKSLEYFISISQWFDAMGDTAQHMPRLAQTVLAQVGAGQVRGAGPPGTSVLPGPPPAPGPGAGTTVTISTGGPDPAQRFMVVLVVGLVLAAVAAIAIVVMLGTRSGDGAGDPGETPGGKDVTRTPGRSQQVSAPKPGSTRAGPTGGTQGAAPEDASSAEADRLARLGVQLFREGESAAAVAAFTQAIALAPDSAQLFAFRAEASMQKNDLDAAAADYTRLIALAPTMHEGYSSRGQIYLRQGLADRAIPDFRRVVELEPTLWLGHELLGDAARAKGDHQGTLENYTQALRYQPNDPAYLYYYMSEAARQTGKPAQAVEYLAKAQGLDADVVQRLGTH